MIGAVVILVCICICSIWTYCHVLRVKRRPSEDMGKFVSGKEHLKLTELCKCTHSSTLTNIKV